MNTQLSTSTLIVGAGLGGVMMALRLARRGVQVDVYERRPQVELVHPNQRSFTVTLSKRGLLALSQVDLLDEAMSLATGLRGRVVHDRDGSTHFVPYGNASHEQLYAIRRHDMNGLLFRAGQAYPENLRFHFNQRLVRLDKQENTLWFQNELLPTSELFPVQSELIIGSDGAFSVVRQQMQRGERADYRQEFLDWGYKDFFIQAQIDGQHSMESNALHLWPRRNFSFFAFPNFDGSYSGNFLCPFDFAEAYQSSERMVALLRQECPDLLTVAPGIAQHLEVTPMSHLITTYTSQWHYRDQIILIGDAAHAFTPFWGEGMNSAFEDARILDEFLMSYTPTGQAATDEPLFEPLFEPSSELSPEAHIDRETLFAEFQALRKPNTDVISDLAKQNFIELRDTTGSTRTLARKMLERWLYRLFPDHWKPLNIMLSHSLMSYCEALERYQRQALWLRYSGAEVLVWLLAFWLILWHALSQIAGRVSAVVHGQRWRGAVKPDKVTR